MGQSSHLLRETVPGSGSHGSQKPKGESSVQRSIDLEGLQRRVREKITRHPTPLVFALHLDGRRYWVKRRPHPKKTLWHRWQALSASLLRLSWLQPTVSGGGPESLQDEAERLAMLRAQGISVPEPILCECDYLVTEDRGVPLDAWLKIRTDR
jgi:hypothetical protein